MVRRLVSLAAGLAVPTSPGKGRMPAPGEGMVHVTGGKVWYRIVGSHGGAC